MFGSVHSHRFYTLQHDVNLSDFINFITKTIRRREREKKKRCNKQVSVIFNSVTLLNVLKYFHTPTEMSERRKYTQFFSALKPSDERRNGNVNKNIESSIKSSSSRFKYIITIIFIVVEITKNNGV